MNEELILKSTILTLIDRKMKLLAELDMINEELIGAHSILAAIPSIEKLKSNILSSTPLLAPSKVCERCQGEIINPGKNAKLCKPCKHKSRSEAAQRRWKETGRKKDASSLTPVQ
jgi:tRNA(Ile2) C34 agmatinyltransferase TiaS